MTNTFFYPALIMPNIVRNFGMPCLWYDNSLKVEAYTDAVSTTNERDMCAACYIVNKWSNT